MLSVVIPTYKNKEKLINNLEKNIRFLKNYEVIVVNDDPTESIRNDLKKFYLITLLENSENLGFGQTVNKGIHHAKNELILLLNSDVLLIDTSFQRAINQMKKNSQLFAISFAQKEKNNSLVGKNKFIWRDGFFYHSKADNLQFGFNGWAEGGSCILNKKKFDHLNGFDELYTPFYWEDIDLSYRAWKAGYKVIFDPDIVVEHHHETTISKYFTKQDIQKIAYRNQFIFIWKNISDTDLLLEHVVYLPLHILRFMINRNTVALLGFIKALTRTKKILTRRRQQKKDYIITDKKILEML